MKQQFKARKRFRFTTCISALFFGTFVFLTDPDAAIPCLIAAAFHECGHVLSAHILKIPLKELKLDLFGARISVSSGLISYTEEFLLCAAGPFFSFLLSGGLSLPVVHSSFLTSVRDASLFLGLLNLIPVRGFDGGRMLSAALAHLGSARVADLVLDFFTGLFLILLWGVSVYLLLVVDGGFTLFLFASGMFVKIFLS